MRDINFNLDKHTHLLFEFEEKLIFTIGNRNSSFVKVYKNYKVTYKIFNKLLI